MSISAEELPSHIESALFASDAKRADIESLCREAMQKGYHAVCVNTSRIVLACSILEESQVQVSALIDFPLGLADADAKRYETEIAADLGAHEIDYVVNISRLKDGDHKYVLREMRDIAEAADERPVKAVFDTRLLTREEKILACQLTLDSGAQFFGAGLDFYPTGPSVDDVKLLRESLGAEFGLKVCANIRTLEEALEYLNAGATRIGWNSPGLE